MVPRKLQKFLKMNLGKQKNCRQVKFYHLFLHLIQKTHLLITQSRIPFKSLKEIMFDDLRASNLLTVSDNHPTLRNW